MLSQKEQYEILKKLPISDELKKKIMKIAEKDFQYKSNFNKVMSQIIMNHRESS